MHIDPQKVMTFSSPEELEDWLAENHADPEGIWVRFYKKASGLISVTYDEALDVALCYGWIDGLVKKYDEVSYVQRFVPRRAKSVWSKTNRRHVERLTEMGRMKAPGVRAVDAAKNDGRWDAAYDSARTSEVPPDFQEALEANPAAGEFFNTLDRTNRYSVLFRIQTAAKPETRTRRIQTLVEMLCRREKFHP